MWFCPHSVIRAKYYAEDKLAGAPDGFKSAPVNARGYPEAKFTLQFYVEDCIQEQIEIEEAANEAKTLAYADSSPETMTYFPPASAGPYGLVPERYLDLVRRGTDAVGIPVIASLNGSSKAGWVEYATLIEQAGAAAIELNMYHIPADLPESGRDIEARYVDIVDAVCRATARPVLVKLTPYLSAIGHFATTLVDHGAAGLVLFNRLLEPDIDLAAMRLATSSGVTSPAEVIKCILAEADAVMTTSAILRDGVGAISTPVDGLHGWMQDREIPDLSVMRGMMRWERSRDRSVSTRANSLRILERYACA